MLPFANLGGDPEQDYFADGVVDDIITALSRFRSFAVIARNSSFVYKGRAVDVRQVAQELGVRYVLEGSVRRAGDRLRITAQLVDGATGAHLWAEHFDGALDDVFDFQDRITESVAMLVEPQIQSAEIARSRRERPGSIAAYDIYLQALPKINDETSSENAEAHALLTEALALEPDNALLLAHTAWALAHRTAMGWPPIGAGRQARMHRAGASGPAAGRRRSDGDGALRHVPDPGGAGTTTGDGGNAVGAQGQPEQPAGRYRGRCRAPALRQRRGGLAVFHRAPG